jgi:hypothetical protein
MDITIEERAVGRVTVLDIVGRLTIDRGAERLKDKINSLLAQERTASSSISRPCRISTAVVWASSWPPTDRS